MSNLSFFQLIYLLFFDLDRVKATGLDFFLFFDQFNLSFFFRLVNSERAVFIADRAFRFPFPMPICMLRLMPFVSDASVLLKPACLSDSIQK